MRNYAFHATDMSQLHHGLSECIENNFRPTLAVAFSSIYMPMDEVCAVFRNLNIELFGCTTAGEILNDSLLSNGISVMLLDIPKAQFKLFAGKSDTSGRRYNMGQEGGKFIKDAFQNPAALVLASGIGEDGAALVDGIKSVLDSEIPVFGALAGDDLQITATYCLHNGGVIENGSLVLVFDGDHIEINGLAASGWEAIGTDHVITSSGGNIVYAINHEPALDVFIKYFGYFDNTDVGGQPISSISAQYPLQVLRPDGTRVLRSPLFANEVDRSLVLAGGVHEGDHFRFSISPGDIVIDQTIEDFGALKQTYAETDAMILFSCKGRHAALGPLLEDEIAGLHQYWNQNMIGFLSYGEIGPTANGSCDFHNETCSLVLIRNK